MLEGNPLTGSLSQGSLYDRYDGTGGSSAIKDLNLLDEYGNNIINATNQIDENLHYYSFAIEDSEIETGDGNDEFKIKNYRGYYAIGLKNSTLSSGNGSDKVIIELLEDRFVYGAFGLEDSEINTGSDDDEVEIKITSSNNDAFTSYAVKNSSIKLGEGNDNLNITQNNSSGNLDIAISGDVSNSVLYDFGSGDDIGSFSSEGYGIKSDGDSKHRVVLGAGNDSFTISSVYSAFYKSNLFANEGDDEIDLRASNQFHYGIEDSDIYLGDGDDYLTLDSSKNSNIDGGEGTDIIKILDSSENYNIENLQSNNFEITSSVDGFFKLNLTDVEQISFDDQNISLLDETATNLKIRGNSFYLVVEGPTWTEAEANGNKFGGHLVTINDAEENQWLVDNFPHETSWYTYWIGLNDENEEGAYQWSSGEEFTYSNWRPTSGPNRISTDKSSIGPSYIEFQVNDLNESKAGQWNDHPPDHLNNPVGIAEIPFIRRNDSAYVIIEGPTWEEAEANAVSLGGHLVSINDSEENEWIKSEFSKENYYYSGDSNPGDPETWLHFWIGATDKNIEGQWEWSSGEEWNFNDEIESENLTANYQYPERDYIAVIFNVPTMGNYYWSNGEDKYDPNNNNNFRGIAEIKLAPNNLPTGELLINGNLNVGETLTIDYSNISDLDNYEGYTPTYNYSWEISDDFGVSWNALTTEDGTNNDNSYILTSNEVGKKLRGSISYVDGYGSTESITSSASEEIIASLKIRGNSFYKIVDSDINGSWISAQENALNLGGQLVTINDEYEHQFILDSYSNYNYENHYGVPTNEDGKVTVFIGLNDSANEGNWEWVTGQSSSWEPNWGGKDRINNIQPDNHTGVEHYAELYLQETTYFYKGQLNDVNNESIRGIAEIPFIRRNNSAYVIVDGPTWEEAEASAIALGGHLVTINDAEENNWIYSNFGGGNWIGITDKSTEGVWEWISGDEVEYTNWYQGQPSNSIHSSTGKDQDYGWMHTDFLGEWDDHFDSNDVGTSATHGIVEIKLASNNLPTGEVLINGNLNVGESLTIDLSNISDVDNYEGYTPNYNYSWEISEDFGVSWSSLNTEDGTGNNSSYTLTSNEVGKKLRGSISYVDGYGSTESITSAASEEVAPVLLIREGKFYKVVDGPSWSDAEANAVALGGHLVTINSSEENDWIFANFEEVLVGASEGLGLMIGFTDQEEEGSWKWTSEEEVTYTNWGTNQPDNSRGLENHSVIGWDNGTWNDIQEDWWNLPAVSTNRNDVKGLAEIPLSYFSISDLTLEEGDRGFITINRLGNILTTQNLNLISADGTALDGFDYNLINESISFSSGETSKKIFFRTIEDSEYESTETFSLIITASKADEIPGQISDGEALITINDDDDDMQGVITADFYVADISIVEGETGTLTITRSGNTSTSQNIVVTSSDNSALGEFDYKSINQNLSFSPGELFKTVSIETIEDNIEEFNETFFVLIQQSTEDIVPAQIINDQATITIQDNDQGNSSNEELFKISTQINIPREGYICTTTVSTQNVAEGTNLYWSISGENIDISDFALGSLTGSGNVGSDGNFSFMHNIANDGIIEGYETIDIKLFSDEERTNQIAATRPLTIQDSAITEQIADIITDLQGISKVVTNLVQGQNYTLKHIRDFDGNSHANSSTEGVDIAYKYQNTIDINGDGIEEAIYTNLKSGRWVTASIDPSTGKIDYSDYGDGGTTRVVGIYDDPLIAEGSKYGGYLSDGKTPAPAQFGATGSDRYIDLNGDGDTDDENEDRLALNSQVRFQRDLEQDNLIAKVSSDYDSDGVFEVYWKLADNSAYLRALMHDDGNIRYSNYQSPEQMNEYLTALGHDSVIAEIV